MLILISILLSTLIIGIAILEGRRWFGAYHDSITHLNRFLEKLNTCSEGTSFMEVTQGWVNHKEPSTRSLARNLLRHFSKEPMLLHGHLGWVVDIDELCNGKRHYKNHMAAVRVEAMPGMLMGAGILFTFLGLAVGVFGLDPTDAEQLTLGVKRLLGGMSMAFLTSIAGIGMGLWWTWQAREISALLESVYTHVAEILHDKSFILLPEEMNYQFLDGMHAQTRALEKLEDSFYKAFSKALSESVFIELRNLMAQSLKKDSEENMGRALKDIHHELKGISHNFAQQAENQRLMGMALKKMLKSREEISQASAMDPEAQTRFVAQSIKLAENFQGIHHGQDEALGAINETAQELKKMMQASRMANADIIKVHAVLVRHLEKLEAHWDNFQAQLDGMQKNLDQTLGGFKGEMVNTLHSVHGEFDTLLAGGLGHFAGAMKDFQHTLSTLSELLGENSAANVKAKAKTGLFGKRKE